MNVVWKFTEFLAKSVMGFILKLFRIEWNDSQWEAFVEFVKFGLVGLSNTVLSYVINVLVLLALKNVNVSWDFIVANTVAFVLSVLWSFYWNSKFVFTLEEGEERSVAKALIKTFIAYGFTGIILNNILSWFWITICGISKFVAPIINLIISVPLNFILNKLWAFKKK